VDSQGKCTSPLGNGNATKRLSTDRKARAVTFNPSQQEQRECALQASDITAPGIFICVDLDLVMPNHLFRRCARGPAPCVNASDQPHQNQTMRLVLLMLLAPYFVFVASLQPARHFILYNLCTRSAFFSSAAPCALAAHTDARGGRKKKYVRPLFGLELF
jgi:hypothetical protein